MADGYAQKHRLALMKIWYVEKEEGADSLLYSYTNNQRLWKIRRADPPLGSDLNPPSQSFPDVATTPAWFTVPWESCGSGLWKTSFLPFTDWHIALPAENACKTYTQKCLKKTKQDKSHAQKGIAFPATKGLCARGNMNNRLWNNAMQTTAVKVEVVDVLIYLHLHSTLMFSFEFPHCIISQLLATLKFDRSFVV